MSIEIDILVNGKPVKKYSHNGRLFVEARNGTQYSVRIKNNDWSKILAICSVDGINAIDGEPAGKSDTGYVIQGLSAYELKGFRTSNEAVNAFEFSLKKESYAAKSEATQGDTTNCGVIGIKAYQEALAPVVRNYDLFPRRINGHPWDYSPPFKPSQPIWYQSQMTTNLVDYGKDFGSYSCSAPTPSLLRSFSDDEAVSPRGFDMGTAFSEKEISDKVSDTQFKIGNLLDEVKIFYASRESLIQLGVPLEKKASVAFPDAFPSKFCKPPKR